MRRVYLDNAATSFPKPPAVWEAFRLAAEELGAPAGRSAYERAGQVDAWIQNARERAARLLGALPREVVFTLNATDALNLAIKGVLRAGDHVVCTALDHNSVRRPLESLRRDRDVSLDIVPASSAGEVDVDDLLRAIRPGTRLVVVPHASNVSGSTLDVDAVASACRERGALLLVDAAQTAGHREIDVRASGIDLLAASGHKGLLGPLGTGVLVVREDVAPLVAPWREGGTGQDSDALTQPVTLPERFEAGSPNAPGLAGLAAGLGHIERVGVSTIARQLASRTQQLIAGLEEISSARILGPPAGPHREAVVSFLLAGWAPQELALALDASFGIECRAGLACAPHAHRALGSHPDGACRLSPGPFTSEDDIAFTLDALRSLASSG